MMLCSAEGLNNNGDVVGVEKVLDLCSEIPDAVSNARGINSKGELVGVYRSDVNHGFVLPPNDFSNFVTIDFPGAVATRAPGLQHRRYP